MFKNLKLKDKLANFIKRVKLLYKQNKLDLFVFTVIILTILLILGLWRLEKVRPQKEPIQLSHNISFATFI